MPTSTLDTAASALLGAGLAGLLALLGWGRPAGAESSTYPPAQREVRAWVLLPSAGTANAHPHLFRVLAAVEEMADEAGSPLRPGVRPPGWAFANPLAPGTVTPGVRARWPDLPAGGAVIPRMKGSDVDRGAQRAGVLRIQSRQRAIRRPIGRALAHPRSSLSSAVLADGGGVLY